MAPRINREYSEQVVDHDNRYQRDRIVVIGRRSSGKTVYVSMLYDKLWNSKDIFKVKAAKGTSHAQFIKTAAAIRQGSWPAATQGVSQSFIEIDHNGQNRMMVVLDYPGEIFTDAFVRDTESKEVNALLDHIDHASAVILLVDARHVAMGDVDSQIDNNYGILQAINRIQNWPGGKEIPVVLVLTKYDEISNIIKQHGGTRCFVEKYFSSLIKTTKHLKVCKVSVVPEIDQVSSLEIKEKIAPLEAPLLYCLEQFGNIEEKADEKSRFNRINKYHKHLDKKEKRKNTIVTIVSLFVWGTLFALLVWGVIYLLPSPVWSNLWHNITGK
jgi:GTP-binding protein EngB required for normal cell division